MGFHSDYWFRSHLEPLAGYCNSNNKLKTIEMIHEVSTNRLLISGGAGSSLENTFLLIRTGDLLWKSLRQWTQNSKILFAQKHCILTRSCCDFLQFHSLELHSISLLLWKNKKDNPANHLCKWSLPVVRLK